MSPDRPNIELPGIECNLATEYSFWYSWKFNNKDTHPAFLQTSQSLRGLFVHGKEWILEAFGTRLKPNIYQHVGLAFAFYSPSRERDLYTNEDLEIDLDSILQPPTVDVRRNYNPTTHRKQTNWMEFAVFTVPPLSPTAKPNNPVDPYIISRMVIRDFKIYLDHTLSPNGGGVFEKPAYDPRRVVVEIGLDNPITRLIERMKQQDKQNQGERDYLLQEQSKLPKDIWNEAMKNLEMAERNNRRTSQRLTSRESRTRFSLSS